MHLHGGIAEVCDTGYQILLVGHAGIGEFYVGQGPDKVFRIEATYATKSSKIEDWLPGLMARPWPTKNPAPSLPC